MDNETAKAAQSRRTKQALIAAATKLFGRQGFSAVGLDDIARAANVTTGAIYHNFGSKRALFAEVYKALADNVLRQAKADSRSAVEQANAQTIERAVLGFAMAFDSISAEANRRVLLEDGPTVIGRKAARRGFHSKALQILEDGLGLLMANGGIEPQPTNLLAHMLFGALLEATNVSSDDRKALSAEFNAVVLSMVRVRA